MQLSLLRAAFCERPAQRGTVSGRSWDSPVSMPGRGRSCRPTASRHGTLRGPFAATSAATQTADTVRGSERGIAAADGRKPVAHIAAAINAQNGRGRSTLYKWMWDHFDQISQDRSGRADWIAATELLSALGLTGKGGAPLKPDSVTKSVGTNSPKTQPGLPNKPPPPTRPAAMQPAALPAEPVAFEFRTLRRTPIRKQE